MSPRPRAATRSGGAVIRAIGFLITSVGIVAASISAALWLADRGPSTRSATARPTISRTSLNPSRPRPLEPRVPLYSEDWTEDSGQGLAARYSLPITDPQSLLQVRTSDEGRSQRGIAILKRELARVDRQSPAGRAQALQLEVFLGILHMTIGKFAEADRWLSDAAVADPGSPSMLRANIEALRGVAALRRGETENCVACCIGSSCIFPLASEAFHQSPSGSREAVRRFTSYLEQRPEDFGVQWLLNVAYMTLGEYPDGVPKDKRIPLGPFQSDGGIGRLENVASRVGLSARGANMAGGAIVDDFNGDDWPDIFTSTKDPAQGCSLFINRGDGTFEDRSSWAGLDDQVGALNCNHADYDNDGDFDILLLRGGWEAARRPSLLRNEGDGRFADVTIAAGLCIPIASQAAAWADFDCDGFVDLYIGGEHRAQQSGVPNRGRLYHNNRNGTFTDIADSAGVCNDRFAKGVAWGDYDNDGRPDLYISNLHHNNRLYHNNGDGTFTDVAERLGVTEPMDSFSCWFWDYDNDGWLDIFVAGSRATLSEIILSQLGRSAGGERPRLYHNENGRFTDVTREGGLDRVWLPMGSNFGDVDNDGYLDFYLGTGSPPYSYLVPNVLLHSVGGRRFEDVTIASGTGHLQKGHGIAFADWDRDGDVDIFLESGGTAPGDKAHNVLFQNPGHGNRWLTLRLIGTKSNRAAIGARVQISLSGPDGRRSVNRVIGGGSSFGNNPLTSTIGLGRATAVDRLEIIWPDGGSHQVVRDLPIEKGLEITQGNEAFRLFEWSPASRNGQ
jgi:FG-GAP-like repeat/ASPIC and UnbV